MAGAGDADFFARLMAANDAFRAGLPATLDRLGAAVAQVDPAAPAPHLVAELQSVLHTLAGAAVTFNLRELGQGARVLEQGLRVLTAFAAVAPADWADWLAGTARFVAAAKGGDGTSTKLA